MTDLTIFLLLVLIAAVGFLIYKNARASSGEGTAIAKRKRGFGARTKNGRYYEFTINGKPYLVFVQHLHPVLLQSYEVPEYIVVQYDERNPRFNKPLRVADEEDLQQLKE